MDATIVLPSSEKHKPVYGAKWLAISTPSITKSYDELKESGAIIYNEKVILPLEPNIPAFSIYGPDGVEIVIVERSDFNFDDSKYAIDHIQFLVKNIEKTRVFFKDIYSAKTIDNDKGSVKIQVADANLVLSNPEVFNLKTKEVSLRKKEGTIRIGLDHLGFLYKDISKAASNAKEKGYSPLFKPQRYIYKNKPTVYTFTAFTAPDNLNIEMVQVDGRIGPHSYYEKTNE
jgi:catechol 2,3-dioxygenase-like lactoylglutathione lyase family enzyme